MAKTKTKKNRKGKKKAAKRAAKKTGPKKTQALARGGMFQVVKFVASRSKAQLPEVIKKFGACESTTDNWLRNATLKGLLDRYTPPPGTFAGKRGPGKLGRPASDYTVTAKGRKAIKAGPKSSFFDARRVRDDVRALREEAEAQVEKKRQETKEAKATKKTKRAEATEEETQAKKAARDHKFGKKVRKGPKAKPVVTPAPDAEKLAKQKEAKAKRDARYREKLKAQRAAGVAVADAKSL